MGTFNENFSNGLPSSFDYDASGYRISTTDKPTGFTHSLQTRVITHNQFCEYSLSLVFEAAGQFSFYRRVSSQSSGDYFRFYIDDVQKFSISGQGTWAKVTYSVTAGTHVFRWRYTKNSYSSLYSDSGFITGIAATNVDTTGHYQTVKCITECYFDFYAVRNEQVIRFINEGTHSIYVARMEQIVKAETTAFAHPFLSGDGTLHNPYSLNRGRQLNEIRSFLSSHFKQVGDIDLSGFSNWLPLGYDEVSPLSFSGSYDGGNYKISGLTMNQPPFTYEYNDVPLGLFLKIESDYELKNIKLENVNIVGAVVVGALAASVLNGNITNCFSSGEIIVEPGGSVGGLIGNVYTSATQINIVDCSSTVNIKIKVREFVGSEDYGGLIGSIKVEPNSPDATVNILRCFATGNVTLDDTYGFFNEYTSMRHMGGLIGSAIESVII